MRRKEKWWNKKYVSEAIAIIIIVGIFALIALPFVGWNYLQRYVNNGDGTATRGIVFEKTIYLPKVVEANAI